LKRLFEGILRGRSGIELFDFLCYHEGMKSTEKKRSDRESEKRKTRAADQAMVMFVEIGLTIDEARYVLGHMYSLVDAQSKRYELTATLVQ
jgi:hypothetical protein